MIEEYQQLLDIILEEVNLKEVTINLPVEANKQKVALIYNGTYFYWLLGKETHPVKNEDNVLKVLEEYFK
jgi:hypothetical protein